MKSGTMLTKYLGIAVSIGLLSLLVWALSRSENVVQGDISTSVPHIAPQSVGLPDSRANGDAGDARSATDLSLAVPAGQVSGGDAVAVLSSSPTTPIAGNMLEEGSPDRAETAGGAASEPKAEAEQNQHRDARGLAQPPLVMGQRFPRADLDRLVQQLPQALQAHYATLRETYPHSYLLDIDDFHRVTDHHRQGLGHQLTPQTARTYAAWLELSEALQQQLMMVHAQDLEISYYGVGDDGRGYALLGFIDDSPLYSYTMNHEAAISTAASFVRRSSAFDAIFGPETDGSGLYVNVNDHGTIFNNPEFFLPDGTSRIVVTQVNDSGNRGHMTHVAGTVAAHGYDAAAQGMAPGVWIRSLIQQYASHIYNYAMARSGQEKRSIVGNTSLGSTTSNNGLYTTGSRNLDIWLWDHPYYLHFYAAGNDGGNGFASLSLSTPVAKNTMAVGAVNDVHRDAEGTYLSGGGLAGFSSRGPTYDGRIKPDIVANGTGVYSPNSATGYGNSQGTSMASPNAAGSAILLIDYFNKRFPGKFMRASTTRALIINTADDLGNPGPDYRFGWGVMNTLRAGEIIRYYADAPSSRVIVEDQLAEGEAITLPYHSDGGRVQVTLAWHDIPGVARSAGDRRANLVNNLHLKLIGPDGEEYFPFVMPYTKGSDSHDPFADELYNAHATTGINNRDNVNQVLIAHAPAGNFTIHIDHDGSLHDNAPQHFSLAISGLSYREGQSTPLITSRSPASNSAGRDLEMIIEGSDFLLGAELIFRRDGSSVHKAEQLNLISSKRVEARLDSRNMDWGYWDVVLRNPDGGEAVMQNGLLIHGYSENILYENIFSTDSGLTLQGDWEVGVPSGVQGNPSSAPVGGSVLGYNLAGHYQNSMSATYAILPSVDVSAHASVDLTFYRWLQVEAGLQDTAAIHYRLDSGSWISLWSNQLGTVADTSWKELRYSITTAGANALQVRFVMGGTNASITYAGWNIDHVRISAWDKVTDGLPPIFTSTPPAEILQFNDSYSYEISTTDSDTPHDDLVLGVSSAPAWLSLQDHGNGTGILSGTATESGTFTVLLSVSDGEFTTYQEVSIGVLPDGGNTAPEILTTEIPEAHVGHPFEATILASDADGHALTITGSGFPGWLVLNDNGDNSASLSGTPSAVHQGSLSITLIADDGFDQTQRSYSLVVNPRAIIEVATAEITVNEGDGVATISVARNTNSFGSVSVDYTTSNGTAIAGEDYVATSGTLSWADGDMSNKTITIPIIDDDQPEITEYFNLTISNAQGVADLGAVTQARITILDNDVPPGVALEVGDWYLIDQGSVTADAGVLTLARNTDEEAHAFQGYVVNTGRVDLQQVADYVEITFRIRANTANNAARQVSWGLFQGDVVSDDGQTHITDGWQGYVHRLGTRSSNGTTGMLVGRQGAGAIGIMDHVNGGDDLNGARVTNNASSLNQNQAVVVRLRIERISDSQLRVQSIYHTPDQDRTNSGSGSGISWNYQTQAGMTTLTSVHPIADGPSEFSGFAVATRGNDWTFEFIGMESNAPLDIDGYAPIITSQPQDQDLEIGDTLSLTVSVDAWPPPAYQWYRNGSPLAGATASSYTVAEVTSSDSGSYHVVVNNGVGDPVSSATATVTVTHAPPEIAITSPSDHLSIIPEGMGIIIEGSVTSHAPSGDPELSLNWQVDSAPEGGVATITATDGLPAAVLFSLPGSYVLTMTADDGTHVSSHSLAIEVSNDPGSAWAHSDVGNTSPQGSSVYEQGVYTLQGAGADIWGTADAFHFAYQELHGDGTIIAKVAITDNPANDNWAKAGVMMRKSLDANAANALLHISAGNGNRFQYRTGEGSTTSSTGSGTRPWLRLQRSGNEFTAATSDNGSDWLQQGTVSISMPETIYVGLAVTSHSNGTLSTATYAEVSGFGGGNSGPLIAIAEPGPASAQSPLSIMATVSDDGLPSDPGHVSTTWKHVSGPGSASFANPQELETTVTFTASGHHVLRLRANDGAIITFLDRELTVNEGGVYERIIRVQRLPGYYWEIDPGHPDQAPDHGAGDSVEFDPVDKQVPQTLNLIEISPGG